MVLFSFPIIILLILAELDESEATVRIIHGKLFGTLHHNRLFEAEDFKSVPEYWISQPLDHFNPSETRVWSQRYFKNETYYKPGGPNCIFVGGESEASPVWLNSGMMVNQCSRLGGALYMLEHRFYGRSRPLGDASVRSIQYLSVRQALADLASFISFIRSKDGGNKNGQVILYGGSYSGTLVVYFRSEYPDLAKVSVASSAPIEWKYDFKEFHELSGKVIKSTSQTCHETIRLGIEELKTKVASTKCSASKCIVNLSPMKTCGQLDAKSALDFKSLMATITSSFAYFVQYNGVVKFGIKDICNYIDNLPSTKTSYEKVAETINRINYHLENECLAFSYSGFCSYVSGDGWNSDGASSGGRLWIWQVCNELASFQTTSTATLPFGANVPASFFASECKCAFGDRYTEDFVKSVVSDHIKTYGGMNKIRTQVAYINGDSDPWSSIGVLDYSQLPGSANNSQTQQLVVAIKGGSHCNDLLPDRSSDSADLTEARNSIFQYVSKSIQHRIRNDTG